MAATFSVVVVTFGAVSCRGTPNLASIVKVVLGRFEKRAPAAVPHVVVDRVEAETEEAVREESIRCPDGGEIATKRRERSHRS